METQMTSFNIKKLALTALLMILGIGLFANPGGKNPKVIKKKKETKRTLSANELALYENVEEFYQIEYTSRIQKTIKAEVITKVIVYDMAGNVLQEQDASKQEIDLFHLPKGAKLLMKEGSIHYYVVL